MREPGVVNTQLAAHYRSALHRAALLKRGQEGGGQAPTVNPSAGTSPSPPATAWPSTASGVVSFWHWIFSGLAEMNVVDPQSAALYSQVAQLLMQFLPPGLHKYVQPRQIHAPTLSKRDMDELSAATARANAALGALVAQRLGQLTNDLNEALKKSGVTQADTFVQWLSNLAHNAQQSDAAKQTLFVTISSLRMIPGLGMILNNVLPEVPTTLTPLVAAAYIAGRGSFDTQTFDRLFEHMMRGYQQKQFYDPETGYVIDANTVAGAMLTAAQMTQRAPSSDDVQRVLAASTMLRKAGIVPPNTPQAAFQILVNLDDKTLLRRQDGLYRFAQRVARLSQKARAVAADVPIHDLVATALETAQKQGLPFERVFDTMLNTLGQQRAASSMPGLPVATLRPAQEMFKSLVAEGAPRSSYLSALTSYVMTTPEGAQWWQQFKENPTAEAAQHMFSRAMSYVRSIGLRPDQRVDPSMLLADLDDRARAGLLAGEHAQAAFDMQLSDTVRNAFLNPEAYVAELDPASAVERRSQGAFSSLSARDLGLLSRAPVAALIRTYAAQRAADRMFGAPNAERSLASGLYQFGRTIEQQGRQSPNP